VALILETPTVCRLPEAWGRSRVLKELQNKLAYEDMRVTYEWKTWSKVQKRDDAWIQNPSGRRHWFVEAEGREALDLKVEALNAQRSQTVLFSDAKGWWTYSGLAPRLADWYGEKIERAYELPEHKILPWENRPEHDPRWYQAQSVERLIPLGHGGVELATGLGKSYIIALLFKKLGLPGIVLAPTLNIAEQLYEDLVNLFGKKRVGQFFDGKKEAAKHLVVAVSKSLTILADDSPLWPVIQGKKVLIGDESHMLPADTLSKVVLGKLGHVPYRFFMSGTQLRTDGLQLVLDGIVGEIVISMNVRQGVEGKFLSPMRMFQMHFNSDRNFASGDVIKMNRFHLHQHDGVYKHAASMAKWGINNGRRILVMTEEVSQFGRYLNHFLANGGNPDRIGFAHGGVDKSNKKEVPEAFHKSDPMKLVKRFDAGDLDVLVGTSCIGMGTDIKSASLVQDIVGGNAEAQLRQRVGRGTRLFANKKDCIYTDYAISNIPPLAKQAEKRAVILEDIYGPVTTRKV
jgi:superfamily II DNA or RNA helicase